MGLLNVFSGQKKYFAFEISFSQSNDVSVKISLVQEKVNREEYIQLFAYYLGRVFSNLGFPDNRSSQILFGGLIKILANEINSGLGSIDCFETIGVNDVCSYVNSIEKPILKVLGEYYAKGDSERWPVIEFPKNITEQQVVFSVLALLQFCIYKITDQENLLELLSQTIMNMLSIYKDTPYQAFDKASNSQIEYITHMAREVPKNAYRIAKETIENENYTF